MRHILIIDDDLYIGNLLEEALTQAIRHPALIRVQKRFSRCHGSARILRCLI